MSKFIPLWSRCVRFLSESPVSILLTFCACGALVYALSGFVRDARAVASSPQGESSPDGLWQDVSGQQANAQLEASTPSTQGERVPRRARRLRLDREALAETLSRAQHESEISLSESRTVITVPFPDGSFARFQLQESPVMESEIAARYPDIKSYRGHKLGDPTTTMRCDFTPQGFHALVIGPNGEQIINVHPAADNAAGSAAEYVSYDGQDLEGLLGNLECAVDEGQHLKAPRRQRYSRAVSALEQEGAISTEAAVGGAMRNYRIAIATTYEYTSQMGGGTVAGTISSLNTWLNGVNAVFEREVSVHLNLVASNDRVVYTDANDPFSNGNTSGMLTEVRRTLRDQIGSANYDVGHVFGTGGAGIAYVQAVCNSVEYDQNGPIKGGGVSLLSGAVGNSGYVGLLAHELGHQFGAGHSFNGTGNGCGGNRSNGSSVESGSGSTIMGYAGACGSDNTTFTRELRFHAKSFDEISNYLAANGGGCATITQTGNSVPTVSGGADYSIPRNTPFTLTATGGDADAGDVANLKYIWEQVDVGGASYPNPSYSDAGDPTTTTRPIFRAFSPSASPARTFPSLTYILNNANVPPATVNGGYGRFSADCTLP
jgi:hypothetical protein